jgi:predicted secreted Zn-dependent protease
MTSPFRCLAMIAAMAASVPTASAEVRETRETKTYVVRGDLETDVREQINAQRPRGFDALTRLNIHWNYTYRQAGGICSTMSVTATLAVVQTMPRLETTDAELKNSFNGFLKALQLHEDGHAQNGRNAARRADSGIASLHASTCDETKSPDTGMVAPPDLGNPITSPVYQPELDPGQGDQETQPEPSNAPQGGEDHN